jgi:probable selenium-dependent hydroxylase accessory protein YqeC
VTITTYTYDELAVQLQLGDHELISLVGGGGKSSSLRALGRSLSGKVLLSTTTKMGSDQHDNHHVCVGPSDEELVEALAAHQTVMCWAATEGSKAFGIAPELADRWWTLTDHLVVEADGARRRPFKAPAWYEPVLPAKTTLLCSIIGADALDRVIEDQCHRPMLVAAVAGCSPFERLTPARAAQVICDDNGARKNKPTTARFAVIITKVAPDNEALVEQLQAELLGQVTAPDVIVPITSVGFVPQQQR